MTRRPPKLFNMLSGSIFFNLRCGAPIEICWHNVEIRPPTNQLDYGEINLDYYMQRRSRNKHQGHGDAFFVDEVFIKIDGKQRYF